MNQTQTTAARDPEKEQLQQQNDRMRVQNERMRQLGRREGFIKIWFTMLEDAKTYEEAFNILNEEYFEYFGEYKYTDYNSFRVIKNRYTKVNSL